MGYVGKVIAKFFDELFEILVYDPKYKHSDSFDTINKKCDLAIICVPTPMNDDGSCNTTIVESVIKELETPLILIKSTVPPGTTEKLSEQFKKELVFSPEYIGESTYVTPWWKGEPHPTDLKYHDFQIFGGPRNKTKEILEYFKVVFGPNCRLMQTDSKTAELTKYMENSWGATKVTFCNEFYDIAETYGVDYNELRELWLLDGRINRAHTAVFKDKRGFGGKCFPKDVNAIAKHTESSGYEPTLLKSVLKTNNKIRYK